MRDISQPLLLLLVTLYICYICCMARTSYVIFVYWHIVMCVCLKKCRYLQPFRSTYIFCWEIYMTNIWVIKPRFVQDWHMMILMLTDEICLAKVRLWKRHIGVFCWVGEEGGGEGGQGRARERESARVTRFAPEYHSEGLFVRSNKTWRHYNIFTMSI